MQVQMHERDGTCVSARHQIGAEGLDYLEWLPLARRLRLLWLRPGRADGHAGGYRGLRTWRGLITIRWALWLSLLVVLVFALTTGYRLGTEYVQQLLAR